jgi:hypothetical protein
MECPNCRTTFPPDAVAGGLDVGVCPTCGLPCREAWPLTPILPAWDRPLTGPARRREVFWGLVLLGLVAGAGVLALAW